jgi:hypothetical protein
MVMTSLEMNLWTTAAAPPDGTPRPPRRTTLNEILIGPTGQAL